MSDPATYRDRLLDLWSRGWFRLVERPKFAIRTKAERYRARRRLDSLEPGVTVVAVSFNANDCARVLVHAVRKFSPTELPIIIVDNGSSEGPPMNLGSGVKVVALRRNHGHGKALDLGVLKVRTSHFIALDIDAFPIRADWLDAVLPPLQHTAAVSGGHVDPIIVPGWDYVHPSYLAMAMDTFVSKNHTFAPGVYDGIKCDVGQRISERERPHLHFVETTQTRGPGPIGTIFGGVVYHNFYGTRFSTGSTMMDGSIRQTDPVNAWDEAVREHLGEF